MLVTFVLSDVGYLPCTVFDLEDVNLVPVLFVISYGLVATVHCHIAIPPFARIHECTILGEFIIVSVPLSGFTKEYENIGILGTR